MAEYAFKYMQKAGGKGREREKENWSGLGSDFSKFVLSDLIFQEGSMF